MTQALWGLIGVVIGAIIGVVLLTLRRRAEKDLAQRLLEQAQEEKARELSAIIEQLKIGGRLCIPVGGQRGIQSLRLVAKSADGKLTTADLMPVRFVPMTGEALRDPGE